MPSSRRMELKFQDHIIDSYKNCGGYARKWATDLQVGLPDLCATLPDFGGHWCEVKHRPEWEVGEQYPNPLDKMQALNARRFRAGGALVYGAVVIGSVSAIGSTLVVFHTEGVVMAQPEFCFKYVAGKGYDMRAVLVSTQYTIPF